MHHRLLLEEHYCQPTVTLVTRLGIALGEGHVADVVAVHGVWNYRTGRTVQEAAQTLADDWLGKMASGLKELGITSRTPALAVAYYGHLLQLSDGAQTAGLSPASLSPAELDLFRAWARAHGVPQEVAQGPVSALVEPTVSWLLARTGRVGRGLGSTAARALREVNTYFTDTAKRTAVRECLAGTVTQHRPRVLIAHSLGSVVAYETLWERPDLQVDLLVTVGSPLALPGGIFDRLAHPALDGRGMRPPGVSRWVNISDTGDLIAVPRPLHARFDGVDADEETHMAVADCHTMGMYLSSGLTAAAFAPYL
ncbi:hypothetical protein [Streptomyces clavuligerus]|uniref:hypothetical protein n=1 Tax=Streptomyces clavuligerus TaxID=1901 RepID=UPI0001851F71|nr:hypothetical protein [Streptomyces clavuligerus]WDN56057.1 hypothetical protein LL058_29715 [Streptomyces clavuligerus]